MKKPLSEAIEEKLLNKEELSLPFTSKEKDLEILMYDETIINDFR